MALRAGDWCAGRGDLARGAICCRCVKLCVYSVKRCVRWLLACRGPLRTTGTGTGTGTGIGIGIGTGTGTGIGTPTRQIGTIQMLV
jgi:hypothetical protein